MGSLEGHTNLKQYRTGIVATDHPCLNATTIVKKCTPLGRNDIGYLEEFVPRREHHVAGIEAIEKLDRHLSIGSDHTFPAANLSE